MNKRYTKVILTCAMFLAGVGVTVGGSVYGDEGGGSDSSGTAASCSNNALTSLCGDPAGSAGGGASWKIFKADDGWGLDDYTGYGGSILQEQYKGSAMSDCSDEGWFASFGWDGMKGSNYGYSDYVFQIGPANRNEGNLIRSATYNDYDNKSEEWLNDNNFPNNTRISASTALSLYQRLHGDATGIPDDVGYFCVPNKHKMTVYAKVNNSGPGYSTGDYLNSGNPIYGPVEANHGSSVDAKSSGYNPTGYTFANWGITNSDMRTLTNQTSNTVRDITWKSLTADQVLDVYYWKDTFVGRSRVGPSTSNFVKNAPSRGWLKTGNATATWNIDDCDRDSGCTAVIRHALKRQYGAGSTKYHITRKSNIPGVSTGTVVRETTESFSGIANDTAKQIRQTSYTLKPGQYVCETMYFNSDVDTRNVNTTVCATAYGTYETETSDGAFLEINVKKKTAAGVESGWSKEVYVKPTDTITYKAIYRPQAQKAYSIIPQKIQVNGGTVYPTAYDAYNTSLNTGQMMQTYAGKTWNNGFRLYSENFLRGSHTQNYTYTLGSADTKTETKSHVLNHGDEVGRSLNDAVVTNLNKIGGSSGGVRTVPRSVNFHEVCQTGVKDGETVENCYNAANVDTTSMSDIAYARVPYNFINTTRMTSCNAEDAERYGMSCADYTKPAQSQTFYAGETATMGFDVIVHPKSNSVTDGTYATIVHQAQMKLVFCVGAGDCDAGRYGGANRETTPSTSNGTIVDLNATTLNNANYNGTESSPENKSITFNIPDVAAGTKMCVKSAVYPANSGAETNWSDKEGNHTWEYSDPVCFTVAKKPSIQVWGGNVYSNGVISTLDANKRSLDGYSGNKAYAVEGGNQRFVFGSWGELGVLSNGTVSGFASGTSLGYGGISNGVLSPNPYASPSTGNTASSASNPGGATKTGLCNHAPLSFANNPCDGTTGLLGSTIVSSSMNGDKNDILTKFAYGGTPNVSGTVALNDPTKFRDDNYYYYGNNLIIPTSTIERGTIQVVHSSNNITINGNVTYEDTYISLSDVPKLVVYAEGNINIACNVTRIDAILIATGDVNTCTNSSGTTPTNINAKERSQGQLKINGAVIAGHLLANRTYGAATGANSIIPAEIIDFDPTLYRWGEVTASSSMETEETSDTSINLDTTYQIELAPRL
ncbi:hypothetical protein IKF89_01685 [Candidatus Saccharibacteria bacterium]|nr:hypothetical protein [Candidatus Saccharibacteria bacterium]